MLRRIFRQMHSTMVMKLIIMMRVVMKIMKNSSYWRVLARVVATKQSHHFFYKNLLTISLSTSTRAEHFYLLKMSATVFETRAADFKKEPYFLIDQPRTCRFFMLCCIKPIFLN